MTKIKRLRKEAREAAEWRGHDMTRFKRGEYWKNTFFSECRRCGASVSVNPNPMPNQTNIMGDAVAINCKVI